MPRKVIFACFKRIMVGWHDTEGYASLTHGYQPLASLGHSTFQVVLTVIGCGKQVIINLSEAVLRCCLGALVFYLVGFVHPVGESHLCFAAH